jgi:HSP20 family protein
MPSTNWEDYVRPYIGQRALDRLTNDWFLPSLRRRDEEGAQTLPVNVFEADDEFMVVAPMPGMREEDVQVDLHRGVLTIRGDFRGDLKPEETGKRYLMHEWHYGPFQRTIDIPEQIDVEGVEANLGNGILTIKLPKSQSQRPRQINIRTTGAKGK